MPTNGSFAEVRERLAAKREQLQNIFEEAGADVDLTRITTIDGDTDYKAGEIKRRNQEIEALAAEYDRLHNLALISQTNALEVRRLGEPVLGVPHPNGSGAGAANGSLSARDTLARKGLRQFLLEHKGYRAFREANRGTVEFELPVLDFKTLVTLSTISPQADRRGLVPMAVEERTTTDLLRQGETSSTSVDYYEETTVTNAAVEVAEGASKPESAEGFTLRTEPVRKIATWIPATKEALDDVPFLESQLRGRMASNVRRREELQVLVGDGVSPNLEGILNRTGIQTQAKGADTTVDAVYKAMQLVRGSAGSGFAEPDAIIMHPADYTEVKTLKSTTGQYIFGGPAEEGADHMWGLTVRQTTNITQGTALVFARQYGEVLRREGVTVTLSTEHASYFIENKVAILAESRLALAVYRRSAFCLVTGV